MIKNIVKRYLLWWRTKGLPLRWKFSYMFYHLVSLFRVIFTGKRKVNYLGQKVYFDNPIALYTYLYYPNEVLSVFSNIDMEVESMLDIGGNTGQFPLTARALRDVRRIDIFEPNNEIFSILEKNIVELDGVRAFNYGIGPDSREDFFYIEGQSSTGSLIEGLEKDKSASQLTKIEVELISNIKKITGSDSYDLVVIDVEGFEFDVIKNMSPLKAKYLFLEVTGPGRVQTYNFSELINEITDKFGHFEILYMTDLGKNSVSTDILLKFID